MPQLDRKEEPYWKKVHKRMATSKAVDVLNRVVAGDDTVTAMQAKYSFEMIRMTVPQLQSISMEVEVNHQVSLEDVRTQLLTSGLDPTQIFRMIENNDSAVIEHPSTDDKALISQEKSDSSDE